MKRIAVGLRWSISRRQIHENAEKISALKTEKDMASAVYILYREAENTWNNIFRLSGRRLRPLSPFGMEKHDVQAVFPYIDKRWIKNVWEL